MGITSAAIHKNRLTFIILAVLFAAGVMTYFQMPKAEDPGFIIRVATVVTYFPGASPKRVENLVTDKLEKVIQEIPEVDFINSESKTGISVIFVNIKESEKNMRPIWDNLRRKVEKVTPDLPDGISGAPTVNDEFGDVFGIIIGLTGEGYSYADLKDIADDVRDEFLRIPDVGKVDIYGEQEERIFVEYENARLADLGLSAVMLKEILEARNIIIPGGKIKVGDERIVLEPSGNFETVEQLRRTVLDLPNSDELIYLEDIAKVERGYIDPVDQVMRVNGVQGLGLGISMREGGNIIDMGEAIYKTVDQLKTFYPIGVEFDILAYQDQVVEKKINEFVSSLLQAVGIVLGVMLLFLGVRTGMIVASLIPMVMLTTLFIMDLFGIGLDQISLAALIIALGMLVDNAIVMSESIMVKMEYGEKAFDAAISSVEELRVSLLISSLTTSAAFLPIFLAKSTTGEFTASLFKVVSIALLSSWVFAITMIPMFCVLFMKVKKHQSEGGEPGKMMRIYKSSLVRLLKNPWKFLAIVVIVFFIAMQGFKLLPNIFFPPSDRNLVTVDIELPVGIAIEKTEEVVAKIEAFMNEELRINESRKTGIVNWATWIGNPAPRYTLAYSPENKGSEIAYMIMNTTSGDITKNIAHRIDSFCLASLPNAKVVAKPLYLGPPVDNPVEIRLFGKDVDKLFSIADSVKMKLEEEHGTRDITDDWGRRSKKIVVSVDQPKAMLAGVTSKDIAISLQTVLSGFQTSEFREDDKIIPITMRNVAADRDDLEKVESLNIYSQRTGKSVPLKQVADIELVWEPSKVLRRDLFKMVTVSSELESGFTAKEIVTNLIPWLDEQKEKWGFGYFYEIGGEPEKSIDAANSIQDQLPVAGFIILVLLVGQFNSIRKSLMILLTIPLGLIGVIGGLLITSSYFGFMTLLGVVSLAGIVINNAIVLIDRIEIEQVELGKSPQHAIVDAAQQRFRPILLTTATTVLGLLPLWFGGGLMFEPMAIAIIFGLLFSTVLTLGFIPVLYRIFYKVDYSEYKA